MALGLLCFLTFMHGNFVPLWLLISLIWHKTLWLAKLFSKKNFILFSLQQKKTLFTFDIIPHQLNMYDNS